MMRNEREDGYSRRGCSPLILPYRKAKMDLWVGECGVHTRFSERVGKQMLPREWQGPPKAMEIGEFQV